MTQPFKDQVALVTGAAGGIGRASAIAFAREGAKVVVADVQAAGGEETVSLITVSGGEAIFVQTDVASAPAVSALIERTLQAYGRLDYAHNNAGIRGQRARIHDAAEEEWDRVLDTNLKGIWLCMKYELPQMLKAGRGAIVNTASVAGLVGLRKYAPYTASKHGVIGLTKAAALEYVRAGIRVNAVCPGLIDTPMVQRPLYGKIRPTSPLRRGLRNAKKLLGYAVLTMEQPAGRMGLSEEVAEAVIWLCSDAASFVNGHAMAIDGGFVAE
jgi:NAD(P)-dependent dehydrogenase (short-subunit alcohol dehydrogenase family)